MATVSSSCGLTRTAVSSSSFPTTFEARASDPDSCGLARPEGTKKRATSSAAFLWRPSGGYGRSSSLILRFPPNFVRQLSVKARRNCSNIGVAQIVAASWSNTPGGFSDVPVPAAAASDAAVAIPQLECAAVGDAEQTRSEGAKAAATVVADGVVSPGADPKGTDLLFSSDGSLAVHAGNHRFVTFSLKSIKSPPPFSSVPVVIGVLLPTLVGQMSRNGSCWIVYSPGLRI